MPVISMFFGIVILMYNEPNGKHHRPHIHAEYAEFKVAIDFDGTVLSGRFPRKKATLVKAWLMLHREEFEADWFLALNGEKPFRIDPLR